ncbi:hypothetical protein GE061_017430 [Apolygus lucorum]|uniref:Uncharacterized protein n=1 Tax=Apolygus lucorum TaxID=248454 RepID=A0A8S9XD25_APOLU|nr:hypothetical protein GE061_017430 [Apolygus lucorum]
MKQRPDRMDYGKDHEQSRFRPPGFEKFLERKRKQSIMYPSYIPQGFKQESVKELIQRGGLLNVGYVSSQSPILRMRRENPAVKEKNTSAVSIMNEISSVEVLPIIRQSRTIECQRDSDGVVNCHQDDLHYKIRLKHPDLPQDILETLITNLYARLFKATSDKKKRDGNKISTQKPSSDESPFIIVLPPDHSEGVKVVQNAKPVKNHNIPETEHSEDLIIECTPTDLEGPKDNEKTSLKGDQKGPKNYVYSCRWHGKRSTEQQRIVVEKVRKGPPLQSFKVLIDPSKVGLNLLPITVIH